jgi:hypothetical protein
MDTDARRRAARHVWSHPAARIRSRILAGLDIEGGCFIIG